MLETSFNTSSKLTANDAASDAFVNLGGQYPNMVAVTADLKATSRIHNFSVKYPERFFNVGVAEQEMVSFAAGLGHEGYIPFAFTFASFASMRACEQIRTDVAYGRVPVRIFANKAGYSAGIMGATHSALEDCAIMSSVAEMTVVEPGDARQVAKVAETAMHFPGPLYVRIGDEAAESLYPDDYTLEFGKALLPRQGDDAAFIASGVVVHHAMEAAQRLEQDFGVHVRVVDMHTIKPIDTDAVVSASRTGHVICAQDHNIIGGLGYQAAAVIAEAGIACKFKILGCPNEFVPLATPEYLFRINGYDADGLYNNMKTMLGR